jgi:hypothetical protein
VIGSGKQSSAHASTKLPLWLGKILQYRSQFLGTAVGRTLAFLQTRTLVQTCAHSKCAGQQRALAQVSRYWVVLSVPWSARQPSSVGFGKSWEAGERCMTDYLSARDPSSIQLFCLYACSELKARPQ